MYSENIFMMHVLHLSLFVRQLQLASLDINFSVGARGENECHLRKDRDVESSLRYGAK